jgi:predicted nucleic acid-binding protein
VDTSVLLAGLTPHDRHHPACSRILTDHWHELVVPAPVLPELDYMLAAIDRRHRTKHGQVTFVQVLGQIITGTLRVVELRGEEYRRVHELHDRYGDWPLGFVDAAVVTIAECLRESCIATMDRRHFAAVRPRHALAFALIP